MDQKQVINCRQFAWLSAAILTGGGLTSVEQVLVRLGKMDAWGSYALASGYAVLLAYVFYQLARRFPGKHLFEITKLLFGKFIGTAVNLLLMFHLWTILIRDLRSLSKFVAVSLLPNTPDEIIVMLLMLVVMYYGKTSVEVVARVTDFFFPFFTFVIVILPLLLSNEIDKTLLQPVLSGQIQSLFFGNMISTGWFGDLFVMGAFLHTLQATRQLRSALRHGALLAALLIGIFLVLELLVLGPTIPGNLVFGNYSVVQQIHITDFLDRVDLLILSIWFPVSTCEMIAVYLALLTGIASLVKQRDYSTINSPMGLLVLMTSLLAFKSATEIFSFGNYGYPFFVIAYQPLLFLVIWLFSLRHPVRDRREQKQGQSSSASSQAEANETAQDDPSGASSEGGPSARTSRRPTASTNRTHANRGKRNPAPGFLQKLSYKAWGRSSNVLVVLNIACLALGLWFSRHYAIAGVICGVSYCVCSVLAVLTSYMELFHAKQQAQ